jgi:hypothetical protein
MFWLLMSPLLAKEGARVRLQRIPHYDCAVGLGLTSPGPSFERRGGRKLFCVNQ